MFVTIFAHTFLTATGQDPKLLPPIDGDPKKIRDKRVKAHEVRRKLTPVLRETREQYETPAPISRP